MWSGGRGRECGCGVGGGGGGVIWEGCGVGGGGGEMELTDNNKKRYSSSATVISTEPQVKGHSIPFLTLTTQGTWRMCEH